MHHRAGLPALLLAGVVAFAQPAAAQGPPTSLRTTSTGGLTVTWQGDPARGCAAAGVCDVRGVTRFPADSSGIADTVTSPDGRLVASVDPGTVRVERGDPAAPSGVCVDRVSSGQIELMPTRAAGDLDRYAGAAAVAVRGRCTGPLPEDLETVVLRSQRATIDRRRGGQLRLGGTHRFAAGPFSGSVRSTLSVRLTPQRDDDDEGGGTLRSDPVGPSRGPRQVSAGFRYAVAPSGTFTTTFSGGLGCVTLDACGLAGTDTLQAVPSDDLEVSLNISAPRAKLRSTTVPGLLAAVRRGDARVGDAYSSGTFAGRLTRSTTRAGAPACGDGGDVEVASLQVERVARDTLLIEAVIGQESRDPTSETRCGGPRWVRSSSPTTRVAVATAPVEALRAKQFTVTLRPDLPRTLGGFATTADGAIALTLRRLDVEVFTYRERSLR